MDASIGVGEDWGKPRSRRVNSDHMLTPPRFHRGEEEKGKGAAPVLIEKSTQRDGSNHGNRNCV